jgi:quercetin dioxygenase-like cupin family protein
VEHTISTPQELSSLVEYQPDSVVSRVLFRGPGGTITLFAFSEGQGLSEHTNPNDAVVQILEGEATVVIAGEQHPVRAGEAVHLPPSVPHAFLEGGAFKMLLTLLKVA